MHLELVKGRSHVQVIQVPEAYEALKFFKLEGHQLNTSGLWMHMI